MFGKLEGYKIIIQNPVASVYINNAMIEKELTRPVPITISKQHNKHLSMNLTRAAKYFYKENGCKIFLQVEWQIIKEDTSSPPPKKKGNVFHVHELGDLT